MSMTERTVELGGGRSLHFVTGPDPEVLFIHGALATSHDWLAGPARRLAAGGLIVDRPGHGKSRRPRFCPGPRDQAWQIREGLHAAGLAPPRILCGHSFGALVALAWAEQWPDEIEGLLLIAPIAFTELRPVEHAWLGPRSAPILGPLIAEAGRWIFDPFVLPIVQRLMFAPDAPPPDWLESFPYGAALSIPAMVAEGEDAASIAPGSPAASLDFAKVSARVAILAGQADRIADPARQALRLHEVLPQSRLRLVAGAGHMVHHSAPGQAQALLVQLMGDTSRLGSWLRAV
jgi:pimeloyl-ACP methyl ester carboxylesterase